MFGFIGLNLFAFQIWFLGGCTQLGGRKNSGVVVSGSLLKHLRHELSSPVLRFLLRQKAMLGKAVELESVIVKQKPEGPIASMPPARL